MPQNAINYINLQYKIQNLLLPFIVDMRLNKHLIFIHRRRSRILDNYYSR